MDLHHRRPPGQPGYSRLPLLLGHPHGHGDQPPLLEISANRYLPLTLVSLAFMGSHSARRVAPAWFAARPQRHGAEAARRQGPAPRRRPAMGDPQAMPSASRRCAETKNRAAHLRSPVRGSYRSSRSGQIGARLLVHRARASPRLLTLKRQLAIDCVYEGLVDIGSLSLRVYLRQTALKVKGRSEYSSHPGIIGRLSPHVKRWHSRRRSMPWPRRAGNPCRSGW